MVTMRPDVKTLLLVICTAFLIILLTSLARHSNRNHPTHRTQPTTHHIQRPHRRPTHHRELQCAPDYHACGSLPAPTPSLPCCNAASYCYRRPPYFSECRPNQMPDPDSDLDRELALRLWLGRHLEPAASRLEPCAATLASCLSLPCCHPHHFCLAVSARISVCMSHKLAIF